MGNIDNKEREFAETLKHLTRTARENKNVLTKEQVELAFSDLDLDETQMNMVFDYLEKNNIGVGENADFDEAMTDEAIFNISFI